MLVKTGFLLLVLLICPNVSYAKSLAATEDSFVMQEYNISNFGNSSFLAVGTGSLSNRVDSYLKFRLSDLPAGVVIGNATLALTVRSSSAGGYAGPMRVVYVYNNTWGESTLNYADQPNNESETYAGDVFNSSHASAPGDVVLFDVRPYLGWMYSQGAEYVSFRLEPKAPANGKITYFNSSEASGSPRLEVNYTAAIRVNINASDTKNVFNFGINSHYTNTTSDTNNITAALREIGGVSMIVIRQWNLFEPTRATPSNTSQLNWSGFNWANGREDEYYGGEWHRGSLDGAIRSVRNVDPADPPYLVLKLVNPPQWIKNESTSPDKYYPLRGDAYADVRYAWKMLATFAVVNMSYPADKVILAPINEPYGTQDTTVGTQAARYENFAMIMRAARDAAKEVNASIKTLGFLDNDPDMGFTRDFFAQNRSWGDYFDILAVNTYLHSDPFDDMAGSHFGYSAWNGDGSIRPNPYDREWELPVLKRTGVMADTLWGIVRANATNVRQVWQTETADKWLAHNNVAGNGGIKIFNTTNDALWWSARLSFVARESWNMSVAWALIPLYQGGVPAVGWGFMESYQKDWRKYQAYNVLKHYNSNANGFYAVQGTDPVLEDNGIFLSSFPDPSGRKMSVFITNHRRYHSYLSMNFTGLPFRPNVRTAHNILNGSVLADENFTSANFEYAAGNQTGTLIVLKEYRQLFTGVSNLVFSDGHYTYGRAVSGMGEPNATILPSSGNLTVDIYNWTAGYKKWNLAPSKTLISSHRMGDFAPNVTIVIRRNGYYWRNFTSNSTGYISFNYLGSAASFEALG